MLAGHTWWHFSEASTALIVVAVISAVSAWQGRRSRRVERKVDQAIDNQDTGNGRNLGTTVHDLAQQQEVVLAQLHTNTRETIEQGQALRDHLEASARDHATIVRRLDELKGDV